MENDEEKKIIDTELACMNFELIETLKKLLYLTERTYNICINNCLILLFSLLNVILYSDFLIHRNKTHENIRKDMKTVVWRRK